jgi:hypothetical protein
MRLFGTAKPWLMGVEAVQHCPEVSPTYDLVLSLARLFGVASEPLT